MSSLIKEINTSAKHLLFAIKKNWHSQNFNFIRKKIWRNAIPFKSKKVQGIFAETSILTLSSSAVFSLQKRVSDFF